MGPPWLEGESAFYLSVNGTYIKMKGPVAKLSKTPAQPYAAPPRRGQRTREILEQELHRSAQEINDLSLQNVVREFTSRTEE